MRTGLSLKRMEVAARELADAVAAALAAGTTAEPREARRA